MNEAHDELEASKKRVALADRVADLALGFLSDLLAGKASIVVQRHADFTNGREGARTTIRLARDEAPTGEPI